MPVAKLADLLSNLCSHAILICNGVPRCYSTSKVSVLSVNKKIPLLKVRYFENYKRNLDSYLTFEPRQANLCLRAFRHDKFQLRMPSHSEGPGIWFSV